MNQRVLITGASGFIGRSCLQPFVRRGYEVIALGGSRIGDDEPGVTWRQADLLDGTGLPDAGRAWPAAVGVLVGREHVDSGTGRVAGSRGDSVA